jgi:hypothetical protein
MAIAHSLTTTWGSPAPSRDIYRQNTTRNDICFSGSHQSGLVNHEYDVHHFVPWVGRCPQYGDPTWPPTRCPARRYHRATTQRLEEAPPLSGDVYNTVHPTIVFFWSTHGNRTQRRRSATGKQRSLLALPRIAGPPLSQSPSF